MSGETITRKITTLGVTAATALLVLSGCAAPAATDSADTQQTESTTQPEEQTVEVVLDDPSATGDYGTRWVEEFGLPKVRNLNVGAVIDQSEASGFTTVTLLADVASPEIIAAYGELLVQMGWTPDGQRTNETGLLQDDWHIEEGDLMRSISVIGDPEMGFTKFVYMEMKLG